MSEFIDFLKRVNWFRLIGVGIMLAVAIDAYLKIGTELPTTPAHTVDWIDAAFIFSIFYWMFELGYMAAKKKYNRKN